MPDQPLAQLARVPAWLQVAASAAATALYHSLMHPNVFSDVSGEYVGMDQAEGTDTYKLKVTLANGDTRHYYMDTDYYVPIKIEIKRMVRGTEQEFESYPGDYKEVNGWYMPFSYESGVKGNPDRGKVSYEKIEANVSLPDSLYQMPKVVPKPASK